MPAYVLGPKGQIPINPRPLWGFMPTAKGLVGVTTFQERAARASIGEFAIELLGKLGVGEETLAWLHEEKDPMATLNRIQKGEILAVGPWDVPVEAPAPPPEVPVDTTPPTTESPKETADGN